MPRPVIRPRALTTARALSAAALMLLTTGAAVLLLTPNGYGLNRLNVQLWYLLSTPAIRRVTSPELYADMWNVLLFVPIFAAFALWVPRWWIAGLGAALSSAVELYQGQLGSRDSSLTDVLTNTVGALLGTGLGIWVHHRLSARDRAGSVRRGPTVPAIPAACPTTTGAGPDGVPNDQD